MLADCGGATLDLAIFVISRTSPLRLEAQVLQQQGVLTRAPQYFLSYADCRTGYMLGSALVNEACRTWVIDLLRKKDRHRPLEKSYGAPLETIVDTVIMPKFESESKCTFSADPTQFFTI